MVPTHACGSKSDGLILFCVHYRKLDEMSIHNTNPLLRMDDCIDIHGYSTVFSSLLSNWGYWQLQVEF